MGEIFIKFPIDNMGLYGGDDIVAAKTVSRGKMQNDINFIQAGHELKGISALISCNIPNLHFPLVCVINYKYVVLTAITKRAYSNIGVTVRLYSLLFLFMVVHLCTDLRMGYAFYDRCYLVNKLFRVQRSAISPMR